MKSLQVLVVEDEPLILLSLEDALADLGHTVIRAEMNLSGAINAAKACSFDLAILDLNLGGHFAIEVADIVAARSLPMVLASGYQSEIFVSHPIAPRLPKPYSPEQLATAISKAIQNAGD